MEKRLFIVQSQTELERCYPVIKELRPHLRFEDFLEYYQQAHASDGYEIAAIESQQGIVAVMGYRFLVDFVRGRHLYIDDLVTSERVRSMGLGAELLKYAEKVAADSGCKSLRLCAALENEGGIRFYNRNGWHQRAYAFAKKI